MATTKLTEDVRLIFEIIGEPLIEVGVCSLQGGLMINYNFSPTKTNNIMIFIFKPVDGFLFPLQIYFW